MPSIDLEDGAGGGETKVERYNGCERGIVERWNVRGGNHAIGTGKRAIDQYTDFLFAHPKP
jgi:hypothetical protein